MSKIASYIAAAALGLLAVHPPIGYTFQPMINSFEWLYAVIASGLLAFFLMTQKINIFLKVLLGYLFFNCFLSQAPASSFNMFMIASATMLFYLIARHLDFEPIMKMIEAVFWMQVFILIVQQCGRDTLMEFDRQHKVFFGTVFQPMRMGSLLAIMAPLLVLRRRWYIIPLLILSVCSYTLSFSLALLAGILFYIWIKYPGFRKPAAIAICSAGLIFMVVDWPTLRVAITEGRFPIWGVILKSWMFDTSANFHGFMSPLNPPVQTGPFDIQRFFFGHGLNTFITLFPFYKYDPNPFPQAHNDFISFLWELGLVGFSIFCAYSIALMRDLWNRARLIEISGLIVIACNMCFAFPWYMTQTVLIMVATAAYFERLIEDNYYADR